MQTEVYGSLSDCTKGWQDGRSVLFGVSGWLRHAFLSPGKSRAARVVLADVFLSIILATQAIAAADLGKPIGQLMQQNWQSRQGLPQNSVLAIAQTRDGYLWLGTEEGVARFDGLRFTTFDKQTSGFTNNFVQSLVVDHEDQLWIGTRGGGLIRLSNGKFTSFGTKDGLPSLTVSALCEDQHGVLWVGTEGGGLVRRQNGKFQTFSKALNGLADDIVSSITEGQGGDIWIGTHGGLSRYSQGIFQNYGVAQGLGSDYVRVVKTDRRRGVWAGTSKGLAHVTPTNITNFRVEDGLSSNEIYSLAIDRFGAVWVGTDAGGVNRLINGRITSYLDAAGILGKVLWTLFEDTEGNMWV